ncbi:alanine racemase, partial [Salmonella enterica]|uniref:alanine racemase n=1 Tax=Salmonella enterica TaxID=28901 RepID=UPI002351DBA3
SVALPMKKLAEIQAACGVLCVDLAAVVDYYQTLARHVAPAQCGAVLKAYGYGLRAEANAPALYAANSRNIFVAQLSKGVALRKIQSAAAKVL